MPMLLAINICNIGFLKQAKDGQPLGRWKDVPLPTLLSSISSLRFYSGVVV
jgi:hypothetical protein